MGTTGIPGGENRPALDPGIDLPTSPAPGTKPRRTWIWVILIVAMAFGFVALCIVMLLVIPTIGAMKKHANEVAAMNSLRTIVVAQNQYFSMFSGVYTCSLADLGGDPQSGPPSPASAQLIPADLASGSKLGYVFRITNCETANINGQSRVVTYALTAVPAVPGKTGDRGFCIDPGENLAADPAGGTNCTQPVK